MMITVLVKFRRGLEWGKREFPQRSYHPFFTRIVPHGQLFELLMIFDLTLKHKMTEVFIMMEKISERYHVNAELIIVYIICY